MTPKILEPPRAREIVVEAILRVENERIRKNPAPDHDTVRADRVCPLDCIAVASDITVTDDDRFRTQLVA
jgi:hypothetical protein